jgi:amidase
MSVHHFQPTVYWNTFASHPPVLRIQSGDTVVTTCVDASGLDQQLQSAVGGPNPQTGPFFVEGAEPGDTLAVHLEHLAPNRATGWSRDVLAPHLVDPWQVRSLPDSQKRTWRFSADGLSACLEEPPAGLEGRAFALRPMLGCLGVAPEDGQAISSATSGPHGGNMDYRGVMAGATFYFPVFTPGALLHLGDGHALQGDGEVVGTGIETSFEVRFSVELLKGVKIEGPRGENERHIFTLANARPLEEALQLANSAMLSWLRRAYGLDVQAASLLLGMCVEYEVANVFDPAYTMVCKLPKSVLPPSITRL